MLHHAVTTFADSRDRPLYLDRLSGKFVDGQFYEAGETEELCEKVKDAAEKADEAAAKAAAL